LLVESEFNSFSVFREEEESACPGVVHVRVEEAMRLAQVLREVADIAQLADRAKTVDFIRGDRELFIAGGGGNNRVKINKKILILLSENLINTSLLCTVLFNASSALIFLARYTHNPRTRRTP